MQLSKDDQCGCVIQWCMTAKGQWFKPKSGHACMELRAVPGALRTKQSRAASQMSRVRLDGDRRRPQATATSTQIHTPVMQYHNIVYILLVLHVPRVLYIYQLPRPVLIVDLVNLGRNYVSKFIKIIYNSKPRECMYISKTLTKTREMITCRDSDSCPRTCGCIHVTIPTLGRVWCRLRSRQDTMTMLGS